MKITVYNFKGGVGKTRISINLALTLGYGIITNDVVNPLDQIFDEKKLLKLEFQDKIPILPPEYNVIFDLGGYAESRVIEALKQSSWTLVPVSNVHDEILITIQSIKSIEKYNSKIIIIANKTLPGDYEIIQNKMDYPYPIFEIKKSNALKNLYTDRRSIADIVDEGGLLSYHYKTVKNQFDQIIDYMMRAN